MSQKNKFSLAWIVSFILHGAVFLFLGQWALPRMVAMKGVGEVSFRVELNVVEFIEEPSPQPDPVVIPEEVITTHHPEAHAMPIIEPIKEPAPPPRIKPEIKRRLGERKKIKPKWEPPQTEDRGNIKEVVVPEILKQVKPRYPPAAIRAGHEGTVSLVLSIGENGRVSDVTICRSSGREDCDQAAVDALKRWWRFRATGKPYQRSISIHFKLE
jgi:protein TonB